MADKEDRTSKFDQLRQQAEKLLGQQPHFASETPHDIIELIHELRIHQAELEIQNEELKRAQQEISELHREYQDLYEFAPCGYLTLNNKGIITRINLTATRLLGTDRKFVPRQGFSNFIDLGWENAFLAARAESAKTGEGKSIELPLKTEKGPPLWVRADVEADQNDAGEVMQWRIVLLDISEEKSAAAALARSEARYRRMMESITDAVYVCSPEQTIEYMNPAMITRLGRDATGEACYEAMHGLDHTCEWCPFEEVRNGDRVSGNVESPLDNRTYRITHMPVLNDDHTISKLAIYRDITDYLAAVAEKEKAQAELYNAMKMESIGTLAGGIAHDFNNILAIILGSAELSLDDIPDSNPAHGNLEEVRKACLRAKALVKQILSFSRATEVETRPFDMATAVEEAILFLRATIPTTIEIRRHITARTYAILADPVQMNQLLINLCSNAAQAMDEDGGILELQLDEVEVDERGYEALPDLLPGRYVKLAVSDTGRGIDPKHLDRIFDPYFTTKEVGKGTGLGLSVVHGIVQGHGGKITVQSERGKGTTFTVLVPLVEEEPVETEEWSEKALTGTERILFVDDEESIVRLVSLLLGGLGYEVEARSDPEEALETFRAGPDAFDLVITDMAMPHMRGDRLAQKILEIRPDARIILCSGFTDSLDEKDAQAMGIKALAMKPLAKAEMAQTVRRVLDEE